MRTVKLLALTIAAVLWGPVAPAADDGGNAQRAAASVFRENPRQSDPALELQRLRNEGLALYEAGIALDDALATFQRAFELSGEAVDAFNVAVVYFKQNEMDTARQWLNRALERNPEFANAHYLLGVLARGDGDFAAAKGHWLRTLELAPDDGHLHYQLALLARSERDEEAFLQYLVNALALEPDNTAALYQMFRYYQTSGNRELAREILDRFNDLKKLEKFSRAEKRKDPSDLSQPVLATVASVPGFLFIDVAPDYQVRELDPGCRGVAADDYVTLLPRPEQAEGMAQDGAETEAEAEVTPADDRVREHIALACDDGRLLRADPGQESPFTDLPALPDGIRDIRLEWFDAAGPRLLALTGAGLLLSPGLVGEAGDYTSLLTEAAEPLVLADLDADGDVDIVPGGGQVPVTNAGKLSFIQEARVHGDGPLPGLMDGAADAQPADLQRDGLSDLLIIKDNRLTVAQGTPSGYRRALDLPAPGAARVVAGDFDNNGRLDLALAGAGTLRLYQNPDLLAPAGEAQSRDIPLEGLEAPGAMVASDYNNDGLLDLVVVSATGQGLLLANRGEGDFDPQPLGDWPAPAQGARLLSVDIDGNGREDLAYVTAQGRLAVAENRTEGAGNAITLFANGVRAAPSGLLTQMEVRRGGQYAYRQSTGGVQRLGIGDSDYVEILRLEWTNGFIENKLKLDVLPTAYAFEESERISGSCPSLFVWNGERFVYHTDAFISGPMGVPLDRGMYFPVNDRETLVIPGDRVKLRDGRLELRFTEELHETVFLDRATLTVVDHPQGTQVFPHSRLAPIPPPDEPFYTTGQVVTPVQATASDGSDLTSLLAEIDGHHAEFLSRSPHSGFAEPHAIELNLGDEVDPGQVDALLATGWFFYFESTSMIAQAQGRGPDLPWPWLDQFIDGAWQEVGPVGIPSGKGKTAVVPLPEGLKSRRLRIRSGISIYWDRIAVSIGTTPRVDLAVAPLTESILRFRGFSRLIARDPERFDYHDVHYNALWSPMAGRYTAYGPAEALIAAADGRYAVFGSGDEISFSFDVEQGEPAPGMARSYLLELVGYVKDGDRYTAHAGRVEPMPYLGLHQYPAPADERLEAAQSASPHRTRRPLDYTLTTLDPNRMGGHRQ